VFTILLRSEYEINKGNEIQMEMDAALEQKCRQRAHSVAAFM
jgi:hypothetical protein